MQSTTQAAIAALLAADATVPKDTADAALRLLNGEESRPVGRLLKTKDVARVLNVTTKTLRAWAEAGALVPVYAPGRKLRAGYTEASVRAFIEGERKAMEGGAA